MAAIVYVSWFFCCICISVHHGTLFQKTMCSDAARVYEYIVLHYSVVFMLGAMLLYVKKTHTTLRNSGLVFVE